MRDLVGMLALGAIALFLLINAFGGGAQSLMKGMTGSQSEATYEELPDEPDRSEILSSIEESDAASIDDLIEAEFPLLDTVKRDNQQAKIYMTRKLTLPEVIDELSGKITPEEVGERVDDKQVLIYDDHFVTVKESDEEPNLVLIELANDEFVRNHYSPGFFQGMFAYAMLNRMLNSNDWAERRRSSCRNNSGCYGGYTMYGGQGTGSFRGSSNRGGGPGSGK
ncbi:DUF4247 domain-containing protein [Thalassobacillus sp. CUG 92003]|uniref:DUF4247 domain-containing protein n=1 Tax=Thalassobacillus sp. CUG 92003 TaxID=2736641 RepID=UPI0015E633CA|nr:DUF4247 domain-containing protein [Thalassobacillus sp. CUG 92003]